MDLVILAGGMGSRFGGLKQVEPVHKNGEFIIDYSIYDAIKAGFDRVVFIIKRENYDLFRETVGKRIEEKIATAYVFQDVDDVPFGFKKPENRTKPWGTGHAIYLCKGKVADKFAIINADDFYGRDCFMTMAQALRNNDDKNLYFGVGYKVANTLTENGAVKRGILSLTDDKYLTHLDESEVENYGDKIRARHIDSDEYFFVGKETPVSMNVWGFTPKIFDYLEKEIYEFFKNVDENSLKNEFYIPQVVSDQVECGDVKAKILDTTAVWFGVTYREDKDSVVRAIDDMVEKGVYPDSLWD